MTPLSAPVRIVLTWAAIFPLVALSRFLLSPLIADWPDLLQTALVMAVVVPVAVLWAVPLLTRLFKRMWRPRAGRLPQ